MSRISLLVLLILFANISFAQTTYTWVGGANGNYQIATNWLPNRTTPAIDDILAFDATNQVDVANVPTQTIGAIEITAGTSAVSFGTNTAGSILSLSATTPLIYTGAGKILAGDLLTIQINATAAFTLSSGTFGINPSSGGRVFIRGTITLSGGILDFDVAGTGGVSIYSGAVINYNTGTFNCANPSVIVWQNGSVYNHNADGSFASSIPAATWNGGAICRITGMNVGSIIPTGLTSPISFSSFIWNCASQVNDVNFNLSGNTFTASLLTITSTNGRYIVFAGAGGGSINVGNYTQTGGNVRLQNANGSTALQVSSTFSQTGGVIDFVGGASAGSATLDLKGNVTKSGVWDCTSTNTGTQMFVQLSGGAPQTVNLAGTWNDPAAGRCHITNSNGDPAGVTLSGTLKVVNINSSSAVVCTVRGIFSGSGSITYSGTGLGVNNNILEYNGSITQTAGAIEFPAVNGPASLRINNSVSVNFPASFNRSLIGTLYMQTGNLNINSNTLSLINPSLGLQLNYTDGYITSGTLAKRFPTSGLPTAATNAGRFPFGSGSNDRSIYLYFTGANLTGASGGDIAISHAAISDATPITAFTDNGSLLDKRSNSRWNFNTGTFTLGSGGQSILLTAYAVNIGAVNDYTTLRLTDAVAAWGIALPTTGSNFAPVVTKQTNVLGDFNGKFLYIGGDLVNPLQIITFTWTGTTSTSWTDPSNWSGGSGFPSAPTENVIINAGTFMPTLSTAVSVNQFTLGPAASFTMTNTGNIAVYDAVSITGACNFDPYSTFTYASSSVNQNIVDITTGYGNLYLSGVATKVLPAVTRVKGNYTVTDQAPNVGTGTFIYLPGRPIQNIGAGNYYNLEVQGDRAGGSIRLGTNIGPTNNTINVGNTFTVGATNYTGNGVYNTFNFQSTGAITIPGFIYGDLQNPGNGARTLDPLGSSDPTHVINVSGFTRGTGAYTVTGSKVKFTRTVGATFSGSQFWDLEISGVAAGSQTFQFGPPSPTQTFSIAGSFVYSATGFTVINYGRFHFNGTIDQTIPAGFPFFDLWISGGNRDVTLSNSGTIDITGQFAVTSPGSFGAGFGSITTGSTVRFSKNSDVIPLRFIPKVSTDPWYNNVIIKSGTKSLPSATITIGGDLTIEGTDAEPAQLTIGNGASNRNFIVKGNVNIVGTSATSASTSLIDFNTVTNRKAFFYVGGNLNITNAGQIATVVGDTTGNLIFNGTNQQYINTSSRKNGYVKFVVGNGVTSTKLTLNNNLELARSATAPFSGALIVNTNGTLDVGTKNIKVGLDDGLSSNPKFELRAGGTLVTANTGGAAASTDFAVEGTATNGNTGSIQVNNIDRTYNIAANYVLNGATVNPFPVPVAPPTFLMNKLTIGANVSLNRPIDVNGTLDIGAFTLTQATNNLEFNGYTSTTGKLRADQSSSIRIQGSIDTLVGAINFVIPGGNTTGLFDINKGITVPLGSDLNISNAVLSGNFVTGVAASILDINGNTLSVDGAFSGPGFLAGSNTSNLTLNGTAGTVKFVAPKEILKDFKLLNAATASLGTKLDISGGTGPGTEGSVQIPNTGVLTTNGNLTIKSSADGTARIATGRTTGGYIVGDVSIERYLSSDRSWRLLSTPTVGQTVRQAWQENGTYPGNSFGTIITSNLSTYAANGFDFQTPGNSLLTYNSATDKWVGVPNTFGALTAAGGNKAYMLFLRGDRTVNPGTGNPSTEAIIRSKGAIFQGNLPAVTVNPGEFAAVSNNYASAVDFSLLTKTNVDASFVVWDPKVPGLNGLGGWVTFTAVNSWRPNISTGSYANVPNLRIESGQAFMIHNGAAAAGTITFEENDKISGSNLVSRPVSIKTILQTNLLGINNNGEALGIDGNTVVFSDEYSNEIDKYDAFKFSNFNENFGLKRNGKALVVEARQPVVETDTVFLDMYNLKKQAYRIELKPENFAANVTAYLEDIYLHTTTSVNAGGTTYVDFEINDDAASAAADRFRVVFKNSTVPAAVITASEKATGIAVDWNIASETNVAGYELERSTDGQNFTRVFAANGIKGTNTFANYNWIDSKPVIGDNKYRVKVNGKNGGVAYSNVASVNVVAAKTDFSVFPNPVSDGIIGLKMKNVAAGNYTIKVLSNDGKLMSREVIKHSGGSSSKNITSAAKLSSGTYQVEITGPDNKVDVIRILVF